MRKHVIKKTGEIINANPKFIQFYEHNFKAITHLLQTSPTAVKILFFLIEYMDTDNALVVSQNAICEEFKLGRTTVYRNVEILKKSMILKILKTGSSNVYCVNSDVAWRKRADQKQFAAFHAKVYLTKNEQDQSDNEIKRSTLRRVEVKKKYKRPPETDASSAGDDNSLGIR